MIGQKFGRLTALQKIKKPGRTDIYWLCVCECGSFHRTDQPSLVSGKTKSCGCLRNERNAIRHITHNQRYSRAYKSWAGMKQRCTNAKNPDWHYYGGAGVKICERWLVFENFLADMGEPDADLTIDRINPYGNYEPGNCRWATRKEQRANLRKTA